MDMVNSQILRLGFRVRDRVTSFEGVITSITFDLYGCVQAIVTPSIDKDGKLPESRYFDVARLDYISTEPVMNVPDFVRESSAQREAKAEKGCSEKPSLA